MAGAYNVACTRPLAAYYGPGGSVVFNSREGYGDRPLSLPCGQCISCRLARSAAWALRCVHEAQVHIEGCGCGCKRGGPPRNCFITLTYDRENIPPAGGLCVEDWQKFAKRLRKAVGPFRFFHCGEYGERSLRPHYHACLFGVDFSEDRILVKSSDDARLFLSPLLSRVWGLGHCSVGDMSFESAAYVARYCVGKITGERAVLEYTRLDEATGEVFLVRPPYVTMSRRPGIGAPWFERFGGDVYPSDEVVHKGRKFRPPRFYDERIPELELAALKGKRRAKAALRADDNSYDRLRVRDEFAEHVARVKRRDSI